MRWDALSVSLVALVALAKLMDSLMSDKEKGRLKDMVFKSWLAAEKITLPGMFHRSASMFDSFFTALLEKGWYHLLFIYALVGGLCWLFVKQSFPIEMLNLNPARGNRWFIGEGVVAMFFKFWVLGVLVLAVAASHGITQIGVKTATTDNDKPYSIGLMWVVDVLMGIVLGLLVYGLTFWCFERDYKLMPLQLASLVLAPKLIHLGFVFLVLALYVVEVVRRFVSLVLERVFGSKDSVLTILALTIGVLGAGGNAISKALGAEKPKSAIDTRMESKENR